MSKKSNNVLDFPANQPKQDENSVLEMAKQIESLKTQNQKMYEMAAKTILKALDCKDEYTYGHSMRVCYFSMVLGKAFGLTEEEMFELQLAALFHDIGKIGTPDSVLNKPTRLNDEEFKIMKEHPVNSYRILSGFEGFENIAKAARHHHERYDGRGYPDQLKADEIPLNARIILIADTFDAMTSTRVYRKGLSYEVAFNELQEFSGTQFDPDLVKVFIEAMKREQSKNEDSFYIPLMDEVFDKDAA
jgi:HD-GYP domain-containing protein (c-di-GMP phosphodiesterase class II)